MQLTFSSLSRTARLNMKHSHAAARTDLLGQRTLRLSRLCVDDDDGDESL